MVFMRPWSLRSMSLVCHYLSVNRTDRLYALREELRLAGSAGRSADRLSETFEVSVRTIKRDVSTLQHGGFPVRARPGPGGGYVVDTAATLPPVNFTDAEVGGLAAAVEAHRGQPFDSHARAALAKVLSVMDLPARQRATTLLDCIWIDQSGTGIGTPARRAVEQALRAKQVVALGYRDGDDVLSHRRADPILLAFTHGRWYFVAYCRRAAAIRWFRLDRIESAYLTSEAATVVPVGTLGVPPDTAEPVGTPSGGRGDA